MSNLTNTIIINRHTTRMVDKALYGDNNAKALYTTFMEALYNWRVAEVNGQSTKAVVSAAFEAGKAVLALFNAELPEERAIRFDAKTLPVFRDGAIRYGYVKHENTKALEELRSLCNYRIEPAKGVSYTVANIRTAATLIGMECDDPMQFVTADNAEEILEAVEIKLVGLAAAGEKGEKCATMPAVNTFRKYAEDTIADMVENVMAKTAEEIKAEKKARNKANKANRVVIK